VIAVAQACCEASCRAALNSRGAILPWPVLQCIGATLQEIPLAKFNVKYVDFCFAWNCSIVEWSYKSDMPPKRAPNESFILRMLLLDGEQCNVICCFVNPCCKLADGDKRQTKTAIDMLRLGWLATLGIRMAYQAA